MMVRVVTLAKLEKDLFKIFSKTEISKKKLNVTLRKGREINSNSL